MTAAPTAACGFGNADVSGIKVEIEWYVTDNFVIDGAVSTLDFEFTAVGTVALTTSIRATSARRRSHA